MESINHKDLTRLILEQCVGDTYLIELKDDLLQYAVRYARIRVDWYFLDIDARRETDENRSRAHNAFIDACNILSRNMGKKGLDIEWRAKLGNDRKVIGDFACYVHAYIGVMAR